MLYERQKLFLALLDHVGGRLSNTDAQKLLFLWSQQGAADERAYEFVPYRYGAFSFTSYADRRKLIEKGLLEPADKKCVLTEEGRTAARKHKATHRRAGEFVAQAPKLRGDKLVALTYRRHPFFAVRSEIASRLLADDPRALSVIDAMRPAPGPPGIVTIGYEGRSLEAYLVDLMRDGVTVLCDVRRNAVSRRYGFAKSTLARGCEAVGIRYEHLPELGIASSERKGLRSQADYDALFEEYERASLPQQGEALSRIAGWVESGDRVALTCFEHLPHQCHRHCVADALHRDHGDRFEPNHL